MEERLIELLLGCLHREAGRVAAADLASLSEEEWECFLALAAEQRIRPLLYQRLNERELTAAVPEPVLQKLRAASRHTALSTMRFHAELAALAKALSGQGVSLLALKGAHLAHSVYATPGLREMNDIDVLLRQEDLPAAVDFLTRRGYVPTQEVEIEVDTATMHHLPRLIKGGVAGFEIHWSLCRLNQSYSIDTDELWDRAAPLEVAGAAFYGLAPEDLLLHLCLHTSYQHEFIFGLRPSCDIAAVIERFGDRLDWEAVCERALRWRWQRGVWLALRLAGELVGAAVPPTVLARLQPADAHDKLVAVAQQQIFTEKALNRATAARAISMRAQPGLAGKAAYAWRQLFPSPAAVRTLHGRAVAADWLPLYYAAHVGVFVRRYSRILWHTLRGEPRTRQLLERKEVVRAWLSEDGSLGRP